MNFVFCFQFEPVCRVSVTKLREFIIVRVIIISDG